MTRRSKIIIQQSKNFENPKIIGIKAVTIEHPKATCKLPKAIRLVEKVSQVSGAGKNSDCPSYSETRKKWKFF